MSERKPISSEEELVGAFDQLFDEIPVPQTQDEVDEYIRQVGIDPYEFGARIEEMAANALKESPLNWRNRSQDEIEHNRQTLGKFTQVEGQSREKLLNKIEQVMERIKFACPKMVPLHYRNRTELDDDDLTSLLEELLFIADQSNIKIDLDE